MDITIIDAKFATAKNNFSKILTVCKDKIDKFYSGAVSAHILDNIMCEYYGESVHLFEIATIKKTPAINEVIVKPYDAKLIPKILILIENKFQNNVVAHVCDEYIRVIFSQLTTSSKNKLVKQLLVLREEFHIMIRNNRHWFLDFVHKNRDKISDDFYQNQKSAIQDITNQSIKKIDLLFASKKAKIYQI